MKSRDESAGEIHDLLLHAVADVKRPVGASAGELITRARRQQRRRRLAVGAAALSVGAIAATALVFTSVGARHDGGQGPAAPSPTPNGSHAASIPPEDRVAALLPRGAGVVKQMWVPYTQLGGQEVPEPRSRLNGRYALRGSAGVGSLEIQVLDPAHDRMPDPTLAQLKDELACHPVPPGNPHSPDYGCTDERLADGSTLLTRVVPAFAKTGLSFEACLVHPDGRSVDLIASSGNQAYGPLLPAPPFTRAQLADLVRASGWFADPMV